ncbi:MAG: LLM class flavin-dependent oxidoreductase, partial [Candidatus Thorarchaeota archaeon]
MDYSLLLSGPEPCIKELAHFLRADNSKGVEASPFRGENDMEYGIDMPIPPVSGEVDITTVVDWAVEAEEAGWDAVSVWDHMLMFYPEDNEVFDPWIVRAAIAAKTKSIKIASNITPLPRRRPWKVARESVSLDHLSNGRVIMGV